MDSLELLFRKKEYKEIVKFYKKNSTINRLNFNQNLIIAKSFFFLEDLTNSIDILNELDQLIENHEVNYFIGLINYKQKNYDQTIFFIEKSKNLKPGIPRYYLILGEIYLLKKDFDKALNLYLEGLKLNLTDDIKGLFKSYIGETFHLKGDIQNAIKNYQESIKLNYKLIKPHKNLGFIYIKNDRQDLALEYFQNALNLDPKSDEILIIIGTIYINLKLHSRAQDFFNKALEINSSSTEAWCNLGKCQTVLRNNESALKSYQKAINISPNYRIAISNYLYTLNFQDNLDEKFILKEHCKYNNEFIKKSTFQKKIIKKKSIIKVGYVSSDFRKHAVMEFLIPILENHDNCKFEIYCFYNDSFVDNYTNIVKKNSIFINIKGKSDKDVEKIIKDKDIDILVDLAGHTKGNRLSLFSLKPCPLQITWIGYPSTTGLKEIDYRFVDKLTDPINANDNSYTEKKIRLKNFFMTFKPPTEYTITEPPFIKNNFITFGSFNNINKLSGQTIKLWSKILLEDNKNKLLLKYLFFNDKKLVQLIKKEFNKYSVKEDQLIFYGFTSEEDHFKSYNKIDIGLDPFPYNGTTTTCEALWMGVPTIALEGDRHVSRVSHSILNNIGLGHLSAKNYNDYFNKACNLCKNNSQILNYKKSLRSTFLNSPIMKAKDFTNEIEENYSRLLNKKLI